MTMDITNIPAPRVEFIDKRTGLMAREWYLFFLNLFNLTGAGSNNLSLLDVQQGPPPVTVDELGVQTLINQVDVTPTPLNYDDLILRLQDQLSSQPTPTNDTLIVDQLGSAPVQNLEDLSLFRQLVETAPPYPEPAPNNSYLIQPSGITVGASPFTFTNDNLYTVDVVVKAGTVSAIEFSRDGSIWYDIGVVAGMFTLSKNDQLRVTYTVAPTLTLIPR